MHFKSLHFYFISFHVGKLNLMGGVGRSVATWWQLFIIYVTRSSC